MAANKKGTETNQGGLGSTYAGTQSPDNKTPDAYQTPTPAQAAGKKDKQAKNKDLGEEYDSKSSYGDKETSTPDKSGGKKDDIVGGSPVR